jgi:broad specificity phosphatase PhoE
VQNEATNRGTADGSGRSSSVSVLYVIRHGQASFGGGDYDRLSDLGREQARILGSYLKEQGIFLDAAYCGTLQRQQDTAELALAEMDSAPELTVLPQINEYNSESIMEALLPGLVEDEPHLAELVPKLRSDRRAFQKLYEGTMLRWITGNHETGEAETWLGFHERLSQGIAQVRAENGRGRTVALFTSGGPISGVMRLALSLSDEVALRLTWVIRNASLSSFYYDDERLTLSQFNQTGHLERVGDTGLITYR